MRRALLPLLAAALLTTLGCQQVNSSGNATISGAQDMVYFDTDGGMLLITSTDTDELRVLDVNRANDTSVDFMRAPNPLEPLSIPVLNQPSALARDLSVLAVDGGVITGPYAYVRSAGSPEVSVVPVNRQADGLVEAARLVAPAVLTGFCARGPDATHTYSTLYVATFDGTSASLWENDVPGREPDGGIDAQPFKLVLGPEFFHTGEAVVDMIVIPGSPSIVVATHDGAAGGRTFRFQPGIAPPGGGYALLQFPTPVRKLRTHFATPSLRAGGRIFGILDEAACGGALACTGVYAVENIEDPNDTRISAQHYVDGQPSIDWSGNPMVPIRADTGIPQDVNLQEGGPIYVPDSQNCGETGICLKELLGSFTVAGTYNFSAGGTFFFDGNDLTALTLPNPNDTAGKYSPQIGGFAVESSDGGILDAGTATYGPNPASLTITNGFVPPADEAISFTYQGVIPDLVLSLSGTTLSVTPDTFTARVHDQDLLIFPAGNGCAGQELPITKTGTAFSLVTAPDPTCAGANGLLVRANGDAPYVAQGTVTGWLGRFGTPAPGASETTFISERPDYNSVYFHPKDFNPSQSEVSIGIRSQDPLISRDDHYVFILLSNFYAEGFVPSYTVYPTFLLPTATAYYLNRNLNTARAYTLYPAANRVIEIPVVDNSLWIPQAGVPVSTAFNYYPYTQ